MGCQMLSFYSRNNDKAVITLKTKTIRYKKQMHSEIRNFTLYRMIPSSYGFGLQIEQS